MILDLDRFARTGEHAWSELEQLLDRLAARTERRLTTDEAEALATLYDRAAADLNRLDAGVAAARLRQRLTALVARAYGEIHAPSRVLAVPAPARWRRAGPPIVAAARHFPRVFRRHLAAFALAVAVTAAGCLLGGLAVGFDATATDVLLPAAYLHDPAARVAQAESPTGAAGMTLDTESAFSAAIITHNIQVSLLTLALGVTAGVGTGLMLFLNGVMLGAVAARYCQQGLGWFVAAWLLPHGAFEIPSVLIAGQAGFYLAGLVLAGGRESRRERLRRGLPDLLTLLGGLSCLLAWAGAMEGFFSQHNAPEIRYGAKVLVGAAELLLLGCYLGLAGRRESGHD